MRWGIVIVAIGLFAPGEAVASACSVAKAQLARLESSSNARYAGAIRRQRAQLLKTRGLLSRYRCARNGGANCRTLTSAYAKMQRNLRRLQRGGVSATKRRRARARVRQACGSFKPNRATIARAVGAEHASPRVRKRVERLRERRRVEPARTGTRAVEVGPSQLTFRAAFARGTYRTMCVRTCDGFAFPASPSTAPTRFHLDAARCNAMCPGRELRLFATKAKAATIREARDVETGRSYESQPFAFRYRKHFDAACSCRFRPVTVANGRLAGGPVRAQQTASRVPTWRPALSVPDPQRKTIGPAGPVPRTQGGVRIVGETYFPD